jgi:2-polyprenyl-3-methyl-5-hydroxy-6-metoxy-1,4-benzoquinol methylase
MAINPMEILEDLKVLDQPTDTPPQVRYQFKPLPGSSHSWAIGHLLRDIRGKSILDVGAGGGAIGQAVADHHARQMTAIEIDIRAHENLQTTYDSVFTEVAEIQNERFDWIVALDILEHLTNPKQYINNLRNLLTPGGKMLVSVPNVAHWSVRFPLFFCGSFEYRSIGIMDASHLYFFTRKRFHRLCAALPQINVIEFSSSIEPFELALPGWVGKSPIYQKLIPARRLFAKVLPGLMAYQHLALLQDSPSNDVTS